MANLLDETQGPINDNGRDIHVIDRQLPVTITFKSTLFEIALWVTIPVLTLLYVSFMGNKLESPEMVALIGCVCGILPGVIFIFMKISARNYFQQLEQRIQAEASRDEGCGCIARRENQRRQPQRRKQPAEYGLRTTVSSS